MKYSISQVAAATGAEPGTVRAWLNRYSFWFDSFGVSGKFRWTLADALTVAIIQRLSADFGCEPPALVGRINIVAKALREFVYNFKNRLDSAPDDKLLPGPWLVVGPSGAVLSESFAEIAAKWQAAQDGDAGVGDAFLVLNLGPLLVSVRHGLRLAGAEIE